MRLRFFHYNEQHNDDPERTLAGPALADALPAALVVAAFPNPAWAVATVQIAVPKVQWLFVTVYDLLGRRVAVVYDGPLTAGTHARRLDTEQLPPGLYVIRAGRTVASQRLTVVR